MEFIDSPLRPITKKEFDNFDKLIKNYICKIIINNNKYYETGYFCKIPFPDKLNFISVLIINNHLFKEIIDKEKIIQFEMENDKLFFQLIIDDSRMIYANSQYDITIIEIKNNDNLDINSFLEIDSQIFKTNLNEIYKNTYIFSISYNSKESKALFYFGKMKIINDDNINFNYYYCYNYNRSLLLNLDNFKVIGIQKKNDDINSKENKGIFLKL